MREYWNPRTSNSKNKVIPSSLLFLMCLIALFFCTMWFQGEARADEDICGEDQGGLQNPNHPHPDEFQSSSTMTDWGQRYFTGKPEVAVFKHGFWERMTGILGEGKISVVYINENFNPVELIKHFNVIVIPSGGLINLSNNAGLKAAFEEYTSMGGTIIAMSQQTSNDLRLLPGGEVKGIGYSDEQNWSRSFMYFNQYHPELSARMAGIKTFINTNIDGYFTSFPKETTILGIDQDNRAVWIEYSFGKGRVLASSEYTDWLGGLNPNVNRSSVLFDMITWGKKPESLSRYPGKVFFLNGHGFTAINLTGKKTSKLEYHVSSPSREIEVKNETIETPIEPGESKKITVSDINTNETGIWHVDYTLLDEYGVEIQPVKEALDGRFVIYYPVAESVSDLILTAECPAIATSIHGFNCNLKIVNNGNLKKVTNLFFAPGSNLLHPFNVDRVEVEPSGVTTQIVPISVELIRTFEGGNFGYRFLIYDETMQYNGDSTPEWAKVENPPGAYAGSSESLSTFIQKPHVNFNVQKENRPIYAPGEDFPLSVEFFQDNFPAPFDVSIEMVLFDKLNQNVVSSVSVPLASSVFNLNYPLSFKLPQNIPYGDYYLRFLIKYSGKYLINEEGNYCNATFSFCQNPNAFEILLRKPAVEMSVAWLETYSSVGNNLNVHLFNKTQPLLNSQLNLTRAQKPKNHFN